jgi:hypothetical protein
VWNDFGVKRRTYDFGQKSYVMDLGKKPRFVQKKNSQKFTVIKTFFLKRYFN